VCMVWTCPTMTLSSSALCLHFVTTLARFTPHCQWHTAEMSVHRRRCQVADSSPWRWCLSVVCVLWRGTWWLLRTDRLCRQRHVAESHPSPRLQHTTTRSHCHLQCQSINEHHKADVTFAARHQHVSVYKKLRFHRGTARRRLFVVICHHLTVTSTKP